MLNAARQALALMVVFSLVVGSAAPVAAQAPAAGQVTAQIPQASIDRPAGRQTAAPGTAVFWNDVVVTEPAGRVRITLGDGSILNIGSNSSLTVTQHNAQTRETDLTLTYGRVRARVSKLQGGQKFEMKTNTAVLGVIGTDFFVEASGTQTRVIVFEGVVHIRNINAAIAGSTHVLSGQQVVVGADQPPPAPQPASPAEVQEFLQETDVGESLPAPPARPHPSLSSARKWWLFGAIAGGVLVAVLVPALNKSKQPPPAQGCNPQDPTCR